MWSGNTLKGMPCQRDFGKKSEATACTFKIRLCTPKQPFTERHLKVTWNFPLIRQHTCLTQTPVPSEHMLRDNIKEHERHQGAHWLSLYASTQASLPQRADTQASWWVGIPCAVAKIDRHVCVCCVSVHFVWMLKGVLTPSVPWPQALTPPPNIKGSSQQCWIPPQPWG